VFNRDRIDRHCNVMVLICVSCREERSRLFVKRSAEKKVSSVWRIQFVLMKRIPLERLCCHFRISVHARLCKAHLNTRQKNKLRGELAIA
jgi:hypothetical protein